VSVYVYLLITTASPAKKTDESIALPFVGRYRLVWLKELGDPDPPTENGSLGKHVPDTAGQ